MGPGAELARRASRRAATPRQARPAAASASKLEDVPKVFSSRTLGEFEAASASIPIRPLDRAFDGANIRLGKDPGGPDGARRAQFRRYVASVDQRDPQQLDRLGAALGALIEEVATSKQDFLVKAAERDGFIFAEGVFRRPETAPSSFAVTTIEDLATIDDRGKRLHLLANDDPALAIAGARELVDSVYRTISRLTGEPVPGKAADPIVRTCLEQLSGVVASLGGLRKPAPGSARLAAGAAVTFAGFIAETYLEQASRR
jgi:hypothetical protein